MKRSVAAALAFASALAVGGCTVATDACDHLCAEAAPAYEACMAQWGLAYGAPNTEYDSRDDYDNWCATYNDERRLLADTAEDDSAPDALLDRCEVQRDTLATGNCNEYYSVFAQ